MMRAILFASVVAMLCAAVALAQGLAPPAASPGTTGSPGATDSLGATDTPGTAKRSIADPAQGARFEALSIQTTQVPSRTITFRAQIADTPALRRRGLMFRERLAPGQGMLFIYPSARDASFWMRNTLIALDMIFIREDGYVHRVHENAVPHDETPIAAGAPVRFVLEIAGGQAARLGITAGALVTSDTMTKSLDAAAQSQ
ncbi:MAG: DUF192 domain-containing protein [Neomegalonema sp.]|nr:DUF192 domain-containing protein [Neomegalonema sp.]